MPMTNLPGASRAAERIRAVLAAHPVTTSSGPLAVTVSMGVTAAESMLELTSVSVQELLRAADRHLFTSKHLGRDRATVAPINSAATNLEELTGEGHATH